MQAVKNSSLNFVDLSWLILFHLTFTTLSANSVDDKSMIFFGFFPNCKLPPSGKWLILFSGENRKKKKCRQLKFLPNMLSVIQIAFKYPVMFIIQHYTAVYIFFTTVEFQRLEHFWYQRTLFRTRVLVVRGTED